MVLLVVLLCVMKVLLKEMGGVVMFVWMVEEVCYFVMMLCVLEVCEVMMVFFEKCKLDFC